MKLIIDIPDKTYHKIIDGTYDYGDMNVIIQNGTPLDDVKAEFINSYPINYMGEPELNGASCHFSLNKVLEILDNIGKESEVKPNE
jgi:hypothetical protein